jgi:hypothetical protein
MVAPAADGIDLFKIAGRSISGWIKSLKTGTASHIRQPFCSQLEERLLLWLEYNPQVVSYERSVIGPPFAVTYRLPIPKHAPFAIGYTFEDKPQSPFQKNLSKMVLSHEWGCDGKKVGVYKKEHLCYAS